MVSSSPHPAPPSGPNYSKIGSSSSSLEYSSGKVGYGDVDPAQITEIKSFCAGYGGRAIAYALAIVGVCLLLVLLLQGRYHHRPGSTNAPSKPAPVLSPAASPTVGPPSPSPTGPSPAPSVAPSVLPLSSLCNTTHDTTLCLQTLSRYPSINQTAPLQDLTAYVASMAWGMVNETYNLAVNLSHSSSESNGEKAVLQDCMDQLDQARDELNGSVERLKHLNGTAGGTALNGQVMDVQVWLSSAYTLQDTCWEEFAGAEGSIKDKMMKMGQSIAPLLSMALTFAKTLKEVGLSSFYALHPSST